tara:strand:- start:6129 stop:6554 length:426 start_codon:yes stop_codon:yes gene_type:complete
VGALMVKPLQIIPYNKNLVKKARKLRNNSTPGEIELWKLLNKKQLSGFDFDRQKPINNFIVDFYCKKLKLAIEIDGRSHDFKLSYDIKREKILNSLGVNILRFSEEDARLNPDHCVNEIKSWVINNPPLTPPKEGNTFRFY